MVTRGLRILFLHELEGAPGSEKQRLLEKAVGRQRVKSPNLKTRQAILLFVLLGSVLVVAALGGTITAGVLAKWYIWVVVFLISMVILCLTFWLGGRGATHYMLLNAVRIAEKKFKEQRSNVIVGTSFGAVVALSMDVPKVPLLMLSPTHEQYTRFMRMRSGFRLSQCPYAIIVHGSADKSVPLDDSIRLVETAEAGRCRLEVVDDGHPLKSITSEDMRSWIEEVYEKGKAEVLRMAKGGSKDVDATLFDVEEDSDKVSEFERSPTAPGQQPGGSTNV